MPEFELSFAGPKGADCYRAQVLSPRDGARLPVVYLHDFEPHGLQVRRLLTSRLTLVAIQGLSWYDDMTPWPADRVFADGEAYGGQGAEYLWRLTGEIIPQVEDKLGFRPVRRGIAGYSLAGLFALWSLFRCDCFQLAASMSGSLWYDGWEQFLGQEQLKTLPERVYFSLGRREKDNRSPQVARVEELTRLTWQRFAAWGAETVFEPQPGGHASQPDKRIALGLSWLCR